MVNSANGMNGHSTRVRTEQFAGGWRLAAFIVDTVIVAAFNAILLTLLGLDVHLGHVENGVGAPQAVATIGWWLYYALFESSAWQATPGKKLLNLTVNGPDGHRISFLRATGRFFAKYISAAILMIGFAMILFTAKKQGLHDILAGTTVVKHG